MLFNQLLNKSHQPNELNKLPGHWQQPPQGLEGCVGHGLVVLGDGGLVLRLARHHQSNQVFGELLVRLKIKKPI